MQFAVSAIDYVRINLVPRLIRYYSQNHVHFITTSSCRHTRVFDLIADTTAKRRLCLDFHLRAA